MSLAMKKPVLGFQIRSNKKEIQPQKNEMVKLEILYKTIVGYLERVAVLISAVLAALSLCFYIFKTVFIYVSVTYQMFKSLKI